VHGTFRVATERWGPRGWGARKSVRPWAGATHSTLLTDSCMVQDHVFNARVRHRAVPRCGRVLLPAPPAGWARHVPRPDRGPAECEQAGVWQWSWRRPMHGAMNGHAQPKGDGPAHPLLPPSHLPAHARLFPCPSAGRGCAARWHRHPLHTLQVPARGEVPAGCTQDRWNQWDPVAGQSQYSVQRA